MCHKDKYNKKFKTINNNTPVSLSVHIYNVLYTGESGTRGANNRVHQKGTLAITLLLLILQKLPCPATPPSPLPPAPTLPPYTHTQHNTPPEPTKPRRVYLFSNMGFSGVPKKPPGLPVMGSKPHVFLDRNCWARIAARHRIKSSLCLNLSPSSLSW